ncbi:hypothetical protein [Streptomyces fuscichromogenes]|uniref:Uncharacterized protein n=1 Tax=Streptomyces fuscichromogenes TaxID=1324013 RepID=A0A917UHB6_9ACTN|nr:hypothetical protein [Streptomyces fuscichromogenes]GGM94220.1 hypothetical protein GCM10011578_013130 [Streptomyces fuscichromogenes]
MSEDFSEDISEDEPQYSPQRTVSTGTKRKDDGSGKQVPTKRQKVELVDNGEESEGKHSNSEEGSSSQDSSSQDSSSREEYPGQPVGNYEPSNEPSSQSQSSQDTRADLDLHEVFIRTAVAWAKANEERILRVCKTAGGWESWLEVELYLALDDADVQVSRQPSYTVDTTGGSRADLFLGDRFLVEIKVETAEEPADAFANRVKTDIDKVDAKAKGAASVVGFAWSKESTAACTKMIGEPVEAGVLRIFHDATLGS